MQRFWDNTVPEPTSGCLLWNGTLRTSGYGQVYAEKKLWRAHRLAWKLAHGDPGGSLVLHKCDVRSCVNTEHLFLGSHAANGADMVAKGRSAKGSGHSQARLSESQVLEIRRLRASGARQKALATAFDCDPSTVSNIVTRKTWTHI